jgi:hypothetical protein
MCQLNKHTFSLRKDSEMYKGMTKKQFDKEVELSSKARARVSLYIANKAIHTFMKDGDL